MQIRRVTIERFRGIELLEFFPGVRTLILGPNNAGKSTALEALDLLLHHGLGRSRPPPREVDYFGRRVADGFRIEAVLGELVDSFRAEVYEQLEGWNASERLVVPEPDGEGIETVVRVEALGTSDFEVIHQFAKSGGSNRFSPRLRQHVGWVFDGRARDPVHQLAFYRGGLLDRVFSEIDLETPTDLLRAALIGGAEQVSTEEGVSSVLDEIAEDLHSLGLLSAAEKPSFEAGPISTRELLQALRLSLPATEGVQIPMDRQGRGAQRLVLLAVLLRLAKTRLPAAIIGGFEEPEEALEPLRQAQVARMLRSISLTGGQVLVVTHSPEIVRGFQLDDVLLLSERTAGRHSRQLRDEVSKSARQGYERRLDGPIVRALFARVPFLVEGPGDRAVFDVFWEALAASDVITPADHLGLDAINCEGVDKLPTAALLLREAGKPVAAWRETDVESTRLVDEGNAAAIVSYADAPDATNLEEAIAGYCAMDTLVLALTAIADDRSYSWGEQRTDLLQRSGPIVTDPDIREAMKSSGSLAELLSMLPDPEARQLVAAGLKSKTVAPFEIKGARPARVLAERIVDSEGVPAFFGNAFVQLAEWIEAGCPGSRDIQMAAT